MSERFDDNRRELAQHELNNFFAGLYLTGEPKGMQAYQNHEIAKAAKLYLRTIGVKAFPPSYFQTDIELHLQALMGRENDPEELGAMEKAPFVLGTVVGTAVYHPDSLLNQDQKEFLLKQSAASLRRVNTVEGNERGDAALFVEMLAGCAQEYQYDVDIHHLRVQLHNLCQGGNEQPPQAFDSKRRPHRLGRRLIDSLRYYPGTPVVPPDTSSHGHRAE